MTRTRFSWLWLAIGTAAGLALLFVLFGGLSVGYSLRNVAWLASAGAIFGAIGAPFIEPKAFRCPRLWQMFFSVLGCVLVAAAVSADPDGYGLAVVVGLVLGYLAPYWIGHLQLP